MLHGISDDRNPGEPVSEPFEFLFDGERVRKGFIEVDDLAPALLGLKDLVEEARRHVAHGEAPIVLRVHSDFKRGSFQLFLDIALTCYDQFVDLFSTRDAQAITALLGILGISAVGFIQVVKRSKGKTPRKVVEIENTTTVRLEFEGDEPIVVDRAVLDMFGNTRARDAVSRLFKPLRRKGIDEAAFIHKGRRTVTVTKDEVGFFLPPETHEDELISEAEVILRLVSLSFREGNKWRLSDGANTYWVAILDEEFIGRVHRNEIVFAENDRLRVLLRTRQWMEGDQLKVAREALKILDHIRSAHQSFLPFRHHTRPQPEE